MHMLRTRGFVATALVRAVLHAAATRDERETL